MTDQHPTRTGRPDSGPQSGPQSAAESAAESATAAPDSSEASADRAGAAAPTDPQATTPDAPFADVGSAQGPAPVAATLAATATDDDDETVVAPVGNAAADRPDPVADRADPGDSPVSAEESSVSVGAQNPDDAPAVAVTPASEPADGPEPADAPEPVAVPEPAAAVGAAGNPAAGPVAQQEPDLAPDPAPGQGTPPAVPSSDQAVGPQTAPDQPVGQELVPGHAAGRDLVVRGSAAPVLPPWRRLSSAGALILALIALFGFTLVVQLRSNDTDQGLATARQEDLVRILSDLDAREQRLADEITTLEASQRQLTSGVQGRQVALQEAEKRANELGLLAGTLPARGPGLLIAITPGKDPIKASAILNTVQELRGAGGEVMELAGADGTSVRVVASTSFVDSGGSVTVDGVRLSGPYQLTVIGDPQTMKTALNIPGGVVASVGGAGGTVIPLDRKTVDVTAVRKATTLQYARPVS